MDHNGAVPRKRVTITDVAARAGVSRAAVSKVFNGTGNISVATTKRIRKAADELNWTPSPAAVALRSSRTKAIGLVVYRTNATFELTPISSAIISGIESVLNPLDFGLLLYLLEEDPESERVFYNRLATGHRVDGVILTNSVIDDPRFDLMNDLGMPAVLLGTPDGPAPILHVDTVPPAAGVAEAVEYLVEEGHRHIAYLSAQEEKVAVLLRRRAFDEAIGAHPDVLSTVIFTDYTPDDGAERTGQLLSGASRPTAIMYASDMMAIAGMRRAKQMGYVIPDDLSIVGFDGLQVGDWTEPQLTTVKRFAVERGRAAAWAILDQLGINAGTAILPERPQLIIRGSSGSAPR